MSDKTIPAWGIEETRDSYWIGEMREDGRKVEAIMVHLPKGPDYTDEYNVTQERHARLIAAAPELRESLLFARRLLVVQMMMIGQNVEGSPLIAEIDDVLEKAGVTP